MTFFKSVAVFAVAALVLTSPLPVLADDDPEDELGTWLIWNGTLQFTDRWFLFTESQLRSWETTSDFEEFFLRAIGLYQTSEKTWLGLGYSWIKKDPYQDQGEESTENRLMYQFTGKQNWRVSVFEHRLRLEQRWIETNGDTHYENRFRYRLQYTVPLGKDSIGPRTPFLNFNNEIFIRFGNVDKNFGQNRLYGAWGWQFDRLSNLQLGLLWKHTGQSEDFTRLQIFYTKNFDLRN